MTDLMMMLSGLFGPSGYEDAVRDQIKQMAVPYADDISHDGLGNLYVYKKGKMSPEKPVVLGAYMDECGIMTKDADEDGFIGFGVVGETASASILGKQVLVGDGRLCGVIGLKPFHLTEPEERKSLPKVSDLYIDAGFSKKDEAETAVPPGELGVFYGPGEMMGTNLYGKAMGRSVSCGVLLELMKKELPVDVTFVFTVQHQVGARGAMAAGHRMKAGTVFILDICPGADSGEEKPLCGKGPVVPAMDKNAVFDKKLRELVLRAAEKQSVSLQKWGRVETSGDGGAFMRAGEGAKAAAIYCPAKYPGAPGQMIRPEDVRNMETILMACLEELAQ